MSRETARSTISRVGIPNPTCELRRSEDTLLLLPRSGNLCSSAQKYGKLLASVAGRLTDQSRDRKANQTLSRHIEAAQRFTAQGRVEAVQEYGTGNVNDTYLVTVSGSEQTHFILQRINQHVFRRPELIMVNMRAFTEHVRRRLSNGAAEPGRRWDTPRVRMTADGQTHWVDEDGGFWRAISFISHSHAYPRIRDSAHAREAGYALGRFQSLISDMDIATLHDTLEGFHITPRYLQHYYEVIAHPKAPTHSPEVRHGMRFVAKRASFAPILEQARERGKLHLRPIHGDPKVDNIMIDEDTGQAVSIVDLDTVKPGLVHYDIGDCLRSCCNPLGEETDQPDQVRFDTDLCREILAGYLSVARSFFTPHDYDYLYECVRLIAFELGLRFFTDYLEGNVYFKARHSEHNLARALAQFKLAESIEAHEAEIRAIIRDAR